MIFSTLQESFRYEVDNSLSKLEITDKDQVAAILTTSLEVWLRVTQHAKTTAVQIDIIPCAVIPILSFSLHCTLIDESGDVQRITKAEKLDNRLRFSFKRIKKSTLPLSPLLHSNRK